MVVVGKPMDKSTLKGLLGTRRFFERMEPWCCDVSVGKLQEHIWLLDSINWPWLPLYLIVKANLHSNY